MLNSKRGLSLDAPTIDKLLVVSILVKFLEEIKDDEEHAHTLRAIYKKYQVESFVEAIQQGLIIKIFDELSNEFNGKIFDTFNEHEKVDIENSKLGLLAQFLQARIDIETNQLFLWEQYSFKHLPAEVISAIYENFIQAEAQRSKGGKEKGVVYTPIHLVNFLVDEAMPLEKAEELFSDEKFTVLDPTCGSGVFIVAAFKRLLQWWAINNSKNGKIEYPNSEISQRILQDNIHGIDVKETAILVSIFGLTTALLDKLQPKEIWSKLKLKDLSKRNVINDNFFNWASNHSQVEKFDLVIGNPPFNPESGASKGDVIKDDQLGKIGIKHSKIPRNNFALHFFEGSMALSKKTCMILPASILLYDSSNTATEYRKKVLTNFQVTEIFDFTHLRRDLFHGTADTPVAAIIAENTPSDKKPIEHTVIKRTFSSENKIHFEVDYYDQHIVPWRWAIDSEKQFIWKVNLLGGGRLFHLIYRLRALPSLIEFIESQRGWLQDRGFEGRGDIDIVNFDRIVSITEGYVPEVESEELISIKKPKDSFLYEPPFLIIDQVLGEDSLLASIIKKNNSYSDKSRIYFNRDFIGISAPKYDEDKLEKIFESLIQKGSRGFLNYQLYLLAISSSSLVLTETDVNKSEILSVPYAEDTSSLKLSDSERILQSDVLKYYRHLGKSITRGSSGHLLNRRVSEKQIQDYAKVLCKELNKIYKKEDKLWQVMDINCSGSFSSCLVGFGENERVSKNHIKFNTSNIEVILENESVNQSAIFRRVVKYYQHIEGVDCIFLIKPKTLRYWLRSIALKDADDIFGDLQQEGF